MSQTYRIKPVGNLPEGYSAWDYIPSLSSADRFDSRIECLRAIESANLGPDADGVMALFDAVEDDA